MLTDNEKRWLQLRKLYAGVNYWSYYSCQWCEHLNVNREGYRTPCGACIYGCPRVDMEGNDDDIEFEARVAAKLADPFFPPKDKNSTLEFGHFVMPPMDRLRCARIVVEEEMNADKR